MEPLTSSCAQRADEQGACGVGAERVRAVGARGAAERPRRGGEVGGRPHDRRDRCGERAGRLCACEGGRGVRCSHLPTRSRPPRPPRQHEDEVDPAGLEVRGQGEGPDPDDHCTWPCARLEERLRNCWAAPRGTAGQKHAELMRQRRARLLKGAFLIELSRDGHKCRCRLGFRSRGRPFLLVRLAPPVPRAHRGRRGGQ